MSEAQSPFELLFGGRPAQQKIPPRPLMEAQRLELLARFARHQEPHHLVAGDLVVEKQGLSYLRASSSNNHALMFWRMLDPADLSDCCLIKDFITRCKNFDRLDCLVAWVDDEGSGLELMPWCSKNLRPLNAEELSALNDVITKGTSSAEETAA